MYNAKHSRSDFQKRIDELNDQFNRSVQFLEQQNFQSSSEAASKLLEEISSLLDMLIKDYAGAVHEYKFPKLNDEKETLEKYENGKEIESRISEYTSLLIRLKKYIHVVEDEVKRNYPQEPVWKKFIVKHQKRILVGFAALIVLSIPIGIFSHFQSQKHGLKGQYYSRADLTKFHRQRIDHAIDFQWGSSSPFPKWRKDGFSIRWTGFLQAPEDGKYEFYTHSDDGVRLWVGDEEIINNWTTHSTSVNRADLNLKQGYYPFRLEYFDNKRKATIRLFWKPESHPRAVIVPSKYLVPSKELLKSGLPLYERAGEGENPATPQGEPGDSISE